MQLCEQQQQQNTEKYWCLFQKLNENCWILKHTLTSSKAEDHFKKSKMAKCLNIDWELCVFSL